MPRLHYLALLVPMMALQMCPETAKSQDKPEFKPSTAMPILRMNDHFIAAPRSDQNRAEWLAAVRQYRETARKRLDLSIYDRKDLKWLRGVFTCHFTFMYDRSFFDADKDQYTIDTFLDDGRQAFGGYDAIVLWQGYPRLGVDQRNQFDMYRDMPGGLKKLREVVGRFHAAGVKVFIDYNPWDTGMRREPKPDEDALADLVAAIDADGIFLDTMHVAPPRLRETIDRARRGVAFVPEVHPAQDQLALCSGSWAQWLDDKLPPGMLHLKWIEPAHMQFQIRRWDSSHRDEIRVAFFNGSGIMVWENIFGAYNPWTPEDAVLWRRASRILRRFADHFSSEQWDPFYPTSSPEVFAHRWPGKEATLYTLRCETSPNGPKGAAERFSIEVPKSDGGFCVDLWKGEPIQADVSLNTLRVHPTIADGLGCVAVFRKQDSIGALRELLDQQRSDRAAPAGSKRTQSRAIIDALPVQPTKRIRADQPPVGMVLVPGGTFRMKITHMRRECGCYPDPGTPPEKHKDFLWGDPHGQQIQHDIPVTVKPFLIDETEVSNAEYQRFLDDSRYRPADATNFLAHWKDGRIPAGFEEHPVVYVDIRDARAYAAWAGKRLPTEAEWQLAAQSTDNRTWPWGNDFDPTRCNTTGEKTMPVRSLPEGKSPFGCYHMAGNVWEWTESERDDQHTRFVMIRGGSYFDAKTSIWYIRGGPQSCGHHVKFIRMGPSLDRCATVGFRCVMDVKDR